MGQKIRTVSEKAVSYAICAIEKTPEMKGVHKKDLSGVQLDINPNAALSWKAVVLHKPTKRVIVASQTADGFLYAKYLEG